MTTATLPNQLQRALEPDIGWWQYDLAARRLDCDEQVHAILGADLRGRILEAIHAVIDHQHPASFEIEFSLPMPDGKIHSIRVQGLPIFEDRDDHRHVIRLVGTVTDVTDARVAREMIEQLIEAERVARSEADLAGRIHEVFAVLGHELRTPLTGILGWANLLGSSDSPEDFKEGLPVIERNARAQGKIIDDLLDISRLDAGKVQLDLTPVNVIDAVHAAISTIASAAAAKEIRITLASSNEHAHVNGDLNRLQQVFLNVLSNAVKFTPRGGTIEVRVANTDEDVVVVLRDSGDGIAAEFLPHMFERFRQADLSASRRHAGLGLGLAIVKELVELHGGSVAAASDGAGEGTTITVTLPMLKEQSPNKEPTAAPRSSSIATPCCSIQGLRVLVVDDDSDARQIARRFLDNGGAQVTTASSAIEALELLVRDAFDVIVCDIGMPQQDGYSLLRIVRASGDSTPAIAMTAYARPEDGGRAIEAGFQAHLAKPVGASDLIASVAEVATNKVAITG